MRIDVLSLFPAICEPFFSGSIIGRARQSGRVTICCHDIRDQAAEPHRQVDDRPFGGGPGMVLACGPVFDAVEAVEELDKRSATRILLTPQGERLDQRLVETLATQERLLLIAGHYEGFDERVRIGLEPREISIGDYVLSGGEAAAMVLVDSVVRLLPGVLGDAASVCEESFSVMPCDPASAGASGGSPMLEYPQYTRPREFRGMAVPDILLSGDHAKIAAWRRKQAERRTADRRPDLSDGVQANSSSEIRPQ